VASVISIAPSQAADHLEAPLVAEDGRTDINDLYAFQSPEDPSRRVLVMTVNPATGALSRTTFDPDGIYRFHIDTDATLGRGPDATKDKMISVGFGAPDASGDPRDRPRWRPCSVGGGLGGSSRPVSDNHTDVVNLGRPLTPSETTVGGFADRAVFTIDARPGDVLSLFGMLICTNDGFIGLVRGALPAESATFVLNGYDAGSEENTEQSVDIVDPCSGLGPVALAGDANGNLDSGAIDAAPVGVFTAHPGVDGTVGDLVAGHDWDHPAAMLTVIKIEDAFGDDDGDRFEDEINLVKAAGITTGTVTSGQMAAFINRALSLPATASGPFTDIAETSFLDDINALFASGITAGTTATTYSPNDPVPPSQEAGLLRGPSADSSSTASPTNRGRGRNPAPRPGPQLRCEVPPARQPDTTTAPRYPYFARHDSSSPHSSSLSYLSPRSPASAIHRKPPP
jgi:hypothetical protein